MRTNLKFKADTFTHEGAPAVPNLSPEVQLRRSVLSCLLWESEFYEDGEAIADRIQASALKCSPKFVADLAVEARSKFNLRHAPLFLLVCLAKMGAKSSLVSDAVEKTIQRADELAELLAIYWKVNGKDKPIANQIKKGLAKAFLKFDEYALGKYDRANAVRLRDVMFLVHPKPRDNTQKLLFDRLTIGTVPAPDTWEVALSGGADKKATFERLIQEGKLGYLALLRNLRNMEQAGVDSGIVRDAILARKGAHRVLPFRYVAAARACPQMEPHLDKALQATIAQLPPLSGKTAILVDVSGSMDDKLSNRSDLTRMDAAAALASIVNGDVRVFTFSQSVVEVPPRRGMAGIDAVRNSQSHGGTYLGQAIDAVNKQIPHDRLIVITDEQSHDSVPAPKGRGYMINVASYQNGVGYGRWTHIDGFSEQVLRFIHEHEAAA